MENPYLKAVELMEDFKDMFACNWTKEDARRCALEVVKGVKKDTHNPEFWDLVEHHLLTF